MFNIMFVRFFHEVVCSSIGHCYKRKCFFEWIHYNLFTGKHFFLWLLLKIFFLFMIFGSFTDKWLSFLLYSFFTLFLDFLLSLSLPLSGGFIIWTSGPIPPFITFWKWLTLSSCIVSLPPSLLSIYGSSYTYDKLLHCVLLTFFPMFVIIFFFLEKLSLSIFYWKNFLAYLCSSSVTEVFFLYLLFKLY